MRRVLVPAIVFSAVATAGIHRRILICTIALFIILPAAADAAPVTFTRTFRADYEFSFVSGGPLNPGPVDTPFIPFAAIGDLTFELDPVINDPSEPATVPILDASGILTGIPPSPGFTLPHTISPNVEFLGGDLTNIVRNVSGDVVSADVLGLSMRWEMIAPGLGITLYTQDGLPFDASGVAVPFQRGTVLAGAAPFGVFLDLGDLLTDPLAVIGRDRTLTVVPEPTSMVLFACGALGFLGFCRRRRISSDGNGSAV